MGFIIIFLLIAVIGIFVEYLRSSARGDRRNLEGTNRGNGYFSNRYVRGSEFVRRARSIETEIAELLNSLKREYNETIETERKLNSDIQLTLSNLVNSYLPSLDPDVIARINPLTGYSRFDFENPIASLEQTRRNLEYELQMLETSELYQRRREVEPSGQLKVQLAEYNQTISPLMRAVNLYENDRRFMTLYRCNYGTNSYTYTGRWWNITYYQHWLWAILTARKFNQKSFIDVANHYRDLRSRLDEMNRIVEPIKAQIRAIEDNVKQRERVIRELNTLEEVYLRQCRQALKDHLQYIDRSELCRRAQAEPEIANMIKCLHGLEKKAEYMDEIAQKGFQPRISQLETKLQKLRKKITKYSRTKNQDVNIPASDANMWIKNPAQRIRENSMRYTQARESIVNFRDYELYDYNQNVPWWTVMTHDDPNLDLDDISDLESFEESGIPDDYTSDPEFLQERTITDDIPRRRSRRRSRRIIRRRESSRSIYEGDIS
ncbi:hypothetical protein [Synechococcus sp. C9]|jgi:hypothetical protein|uniref:hypothetical protein n=1 Tax=Synechococcus sp. C9 TaxID=102119 RepID=UPI001FF1AB8D|nr:hypothetical protein [Synechococcus sp. C9]